MSDLDDELLGMVGGDSDDEVDDLDRLDEAAANSERSPSQEAQESVEKVEEPLASKRGVAQKVKASGRRRRKQVSEDEDGEASASPTESPRLAPVPEPEGEGDAPGEDDDQDDDLFPIEGKFHSRTDREHVMSLPEIEREAILAERAEQLERKRQDAMLKKAFAASQSASKQKRKASAAELEDGTKRSTRPRTEKRSALDDYRRAREEKGAARNRLDATRDRRDERSPSSASDRDADGESEVEWAEPLSEPRRDEPAAELKDFDRCRVGRSNFAKVCFYPGFEDAIRGCFARVSIGVNRETGQNMYRMTQIRGFTEGRPYQMENAQGKIFTTDQYAVVAHGSAEKPWPFSACSDSKFMEGELTRFTEALEKDSMRMPSRKFLSIKLAAIHDLLNPKFTEESLQIKFAKQRAMEMKYDPVYTAKQKRKDIATRRTDAEQTGDDEEVARCDAELEALDNTGSSANGIVKAKQAPAKPANQERLALLNQSNRTKNQQEVRQALIAERKKLMKEREALLAKKTAGAGAGSQDKAQLAKVTLREEQLQKESMKDLFGETPDGSRAGTPANGADTPKKTRAGTPAGHFSGKKGPIGALKQKNLDDDVIGGLDLGIDVEI